jgi:hypothetical protein
MNDASDRDSCPIRVKPYSALAHSREFECLWTGKPCIPGVQCDELRAIAAKLEIVDSNFVRAVRQLSKLPPSEVGG